MRRLASLSLIVLTVWSTTAAAADLPVRRIMLYKHGVGYFERSGPVGGAEIVLEFKASEMNDVLKSLTLLDRSGGRVSGVSYESSDPLDKQLQNFGFRVQPGAGIAEVLDQFRGAKLVVKNAGGEVRGSILGARRTQQDKTEAQIVTMLLDDGEIRALQITETTSLRLEDPRLQADLASYLALISGGQKHDLRALRIRPGTARELTVGYVVEAPVWKSSYRLVFDHTNPASALLQGWAIVDNPTNEDWKDVELSLVSGLPISFTQNLYAPHYIHRPEVALPFEASVEPQTFEASMRDNEKKDAGAANARKEEMDKRPSSQPRFTDMAFGRGGAGGVIYGANMPVPVTAIPVPTSAMLADSIAPMTQGVELGELFEYRVDRKLDVLRHQSAMIPFVQSPVKAERVLLFDPASGRQAPFDALLLTNSSNVTLDGGAITVLEGDRYLGEALIETLKPGDTRPLAFAVDLGTRLTTALDSHTDQVTSIKVHRGLMTTTSKNVEVKTYTIRNTDAKTRTLIIQHPVRQGWKFAAGSNQPEQITASNYRFRVSLPGKETTKFTVTKEMEYPQSFAVNSLSSEQILIYGRGKSIAPEVQQKLRAIATQKDKVADAQTRVTQKTQEINELRQDQDRLRQNINNLRGLPGQEAQVNRYAAKLADQEKTIETLQAALTVERTNQRSAQAELDRMVTSLET